jgi:hypothetical protein
MIEDIQSTVQIEEDENEVLLTSLLKAMYTSELSISDTNDIIPLLLLAKKYEITAWISQLFDHLGDNINASNALQCLRLDLNMQPKMKQAVDAYIKQNANNILEERSYLTLDEDQFATVIEMLVNTSNKLQGYDAIQNWIEHDEEHRAGFSFALSKIVRIAATQQVSSSFVSFQQQYCGSKAVLLERNRRIINNGSGSDCAALGTKCTRYKIRLISNCKYLMVGFATTAFNKEGTNYGSARNCYYLLVEDGTLFCKDQNRNRMRYHVPCHTNGTIIEVLLQNNTIVYVVNGRRLRIAFTDVTDDLYPAFDLIDPACSFEFV